MLRVECAGFKERCLNGDLKPSTLNRRGVRHQGDQNAILRLLRARCAPFGTEVDAAGDLLELRIPTR